METIPGTTRSPRLEKAYQKVLEDVDQLRTTERTWPSASEMAAMLLLASLDRLIAVAKADGSADELARVTALRADAADIAKETP